jgi:type IV secretion system protein VirB4
MPAFANPVRSASPADPREIPNVFPFCSRLVPGATGSGKSFLLNFLVTQAEQYALRTVIFDLGHSYRKLALFRGSYVKVAAARRLDQTFALRADGREPALPPCVRPRTPRRQSYRLSDVEDQELYEAIENRTLMVPDRWSLPHF